MDETFIIYLPWVDPNQIITNELGEVILEEYQQDTYEPIAQDAIDEAMAEVVSFYSRNTDHELQLVPVVSPVITLPLNRYTPTIPGGGPEAL